MQETWSKIKKNSQSNQEAKAFLLQKNGISNNIFVLCSLFLLSPPHHLPLFCFFFQKASTSFSFTHSITGFRLNKDKIPNAKTKKALPLHKRPSKNISPFSYSSCRFPREAVHLDSVLCYSLNKGTWTFWPLITLGCTCVFSAALSAKSSPVLLVASTESCKSEIL